MIAYIVKDLVSGKYGTRKGCYPVGASSTPQLFLEFKTASDAANSWNKYPAQMVRYCKKLISWKTSNESTTKLKNKLDRARKLRVDAQVFPIDIP